MRLSVIVEATLREVKPMVTPTEERPRGGIGAWSAVPAAVVAAWGAAWAPGCGSVTAYLQGPSPPAALPDPEVRLVVRGRTEDGAWSAGRVALAIPRSEAESSGERGRPVDGDQAPIEVPGTVTRVVRGVAPRWGFRVEVETPERGGILDVAIFREMPDLDLTPGDAATLVARTGHGWVFVAVRDEAGEVFGLFAGGGAPDPAGGTEIETVTSGEAYQEVRSGEDLCRRTFAHRAVRVRLGPAAAGGGGVGPSDERGGWPSEPDDIALDPGETRVLCREGGACRFVAVADARETDEQECGTPEPPRRVVWWSRVPFGTVAPP